MIERNFIHIQYHKTRIGELILGCFRGKLCLLDFRYRRMRRTIDSRITSLLGSEYLEKSDNVLAMAREQLEEYLAGERQNFSIPLLMVGSDFQKGVWRALMKIPYGQTVSYKDLARAIGNPRAVRAVAAANGANAIGIIVPCHRVIASDGGIGGYAGGVEVKGRLLRLEGASCGRM